MSSKMREALEVMLDWYYERHDDVAAMDEAMEKAKQALAEPLRNCDVGTAEEQIMRFRASCRYLKMHRPQASACLDCPVNKERLRGHDSACTLIWSQMPYESEVTE